MPDQVISIVSEAVCQELLFSNGAFHAVEAVFAARARGDARNFPVVREASAHGGPLYGFKAGHDAEWQVFGVKFGGYWPGDAAKKLDQPPVCRCSR